ISGCAPSRHSTRPPSSCTPSPAITTPAPRAPPRPPSSTTRTSSTPWRQPARLPTSLGSALLALGASLTCGFGDFLGGLRARVLPALTVMGAAQPFGLVALGIAAVARGTAPPGDEVAWSALAAVFGTVGLFAFYRGLATGAMSIVAPIAALAVGIPVIWGVVVSGDHIRGLQAFGFVAAIGGSVAASLELKPKRPQLA